MSNGTQSFTTWLYTCPEGSRSARSIIGWWERRRLAYNVIAVSALYVSLVVADLIKGHGHIDQAFDSWPFIIIPVVMNLCYTAGWVFELVILDSGQGDTGQSGPKLLRFGLWFSLVVVCLLPLMSALLPLH